MAQVLSGATSCSHEPRRVKVAARPFFLCSNIRLGRISPENKSVEVLTLEAKTYELVGIFFEDDEISTSIFLT